MAYLHGLGFWFFMARLSPQAWILIFLSTTFSSGLDSDFWFFTGLDSDFWFGLPSRAWSQEISFSVWYSSISFSVWPSPISFTAATGSFVFHQPLSLAAACVLLLLSVYFSTGCFLHRFTSSRSLHSYPAISLHKILLGLHVMSIASAFWLVMSIASAFLLGLHVMSIALAFWLVMSFTSVLFCMGFTAIYSLHRLSFSVWSTLTGFENLFIVNLLVECMTAHLSLWVHLCDSPWLHC